MSAIQLKKVETRKDSPPKKIMYKFSPIFKQFLTIACCNLLTLSMGLVSGWATINYNDFHSENNPLSMGPLSSQESSLVISFINIGGLIGNFVAGPISQMIGIKRTIHLLGLPLIASSLLIIWSQNVYYLYISRVLVGFVNGGLIISVPIFVNDITNTSVRGALNSLYDPMNNLGIIVSFFLGKYLNCLDQARVQLFMPLVFIVVIFFLPESPEFWIKKNKHEQAIKSRRFYKGSIAALETVEFISKPPQIGEIEKGNLAIDNGDTESHSKLTFNDFLTPHAKRALFISFTSLTLSLLSCTLVIIWFITDIFNRTGSSLSEKNSSILVSITQIIANLVLLNIVERINRRTLYISSSIFTAISYFIFGAYCLLLKPDFQFMPPFCVACIVYCSWLGLLPIPLMVTNEIFPKKIRQACIAMVVSSTWLILFLLGLVFPFFLSTFGLFSCMITLGVICLLNALFGFFFMPETRGKTPEEIAEIFDK